MRSLVIGGAGFIGSHLVDRLVGLGPVTVLDDLSTGRLENVEEHVRAGRATFVRGDVRILSDVDVVMAGHDVVFHLAANAESQAGADDTRLDLEIGTIATHNVLEATRRRGVRRVVFTSSSAVYGDGERAHTEDDLGDLPSTLHGASKLASEALAAAFARSFGVSAVVLRFGTVIGPRGGDRVVRDLFARLAASPSALELAGGDDATAYLHVDDCVDAISFAVDKARGPFDVFNIAPDGQTTLTAVARAVIARSAHPGAVVTAVPGSGARRRARLDVTKLTSLGFSPRDDSDAAIARVIASVSP